MLFFPTTKGFIATKIAVLANRGEHHTTEGSRLSIQRKTPKPERAEPPK